MDSLFHHLVTLSGFKRLLSKHHFQKTTVTRSPLKTPTDLRESELVPFDPILRVHS